MKNRHSAKIFLACFLCLSIFINGCCCIDIGGWPRVKYERTDTLSAPLSPGSILIAATDVGTIDVTGMNVTECNVIAEITVKAPTEEEAKETADQIKITLEQNGRTLKVKTVKPRRRKHRSISIDFNITVPNQTALELGSDVGDIKVLNITEEIKAQTDVGKIICKEISGDIDIRSDVGSVDVVYSKTAPAETDVGSIKTDLPLTVKGKISKNLHGTIGAGEGKLNLKTDVGSITIRK
ncbi:MAG: DUF4097 family beta strand repeat-containing protein [Phycisphaerales bacterium]|jgi:hypothetical protein